MWHARQRQCGGKLEVTHRGGGDKAEERRRRGEIDKAGEAEAGESGKADVRLRWNDESQSQGVG